MPRLLFIVNDAGFFLSHRLPIARAAREAGYDVSVATAHGAAARDIVDAGFEHFALPLTRSGLNPFSEWHTFMAIRALIRRLRPEIVHLVTIKPVIYGGIAARLENVPGVAAAISGLGHLFGGGARRRLLRLLIAPLYRFALAQARVRVIFQNDSDRDRLTALASLRANSTVLIRGSGVELDRYLDSAEPPAPPVIVTFASRLLRPKGVTEFVEAARLLRSEGLDAQFLLAGALDPGNPLSIGEAELERWRVEGNVEVLGHVSDVAALFSASHIVVLPSYYGEGLPKVLLEAAACGRTIVTTDHPGCRDAIEPGATGLLVPVRDAVRLAAAIRVLATDDDQRRRMGMAARRLAEREFRVETVTERHLAVYDELLEGWGQAAIAGHYSRRGD